MWCFSQKKILECFFIQKSCFVWLFLQWQCDSGIILTKFSTKVMFVFIWTNLPSFWFQMKNLVWHVVLSSQTSSVLFHWKILLFVVALTVTLWFWHHLDRNQHKVDVFNLCLCCLSLGITWTNKFDTFLRFHESPKCCLAKKTCFVCWFQQWQCVFTSFSLNSAPFGCLFLLGLSDHFFHTSKQMWCVVFPSIFLTWFEMCYLAKCEDDVIRIVTEEPDYLELRFAWIQMWLVTFCMW